jgi:hypothetical protein
VHFTELHDVIQDLWTRHGQGTLPNWDAGSTPSPSRQISARDINDLRSWLNQVDPPAAKRGFHLGPFNTSQQTTFLGQDPSQFHPGMLVVIDNWFMTDYFYDNYNYGHVSDQAFATWLKQQQDAGVEIFVRIYRSGTNNKITSKNGNDGDVFNRMNAIYNTVGLTRFIPGNEPNNEWNGDPSQSAFWDGVADFYQKVLNDYNSFVPKGPSGSALWEVYFPPMAQGNYAEYPNLPGTNPAINGYQEMEDHNQVISNYHKFTWHAYFDPGNVAGTALLVEQRFPSFLQDGIQNKGSRWPARITESGYTPSNTANRDQTNTQPYFWQDQVQLVKGTMAGGVAVWLFDYFNNSDMPGDCISCAVASTSEGTGSVRLWATSLSSSLTSAGF